MHKSPPPELHIHFWPFKLLARGKEALQAIRWPVTVVLLAIAVCLLIAAARYALKPYALHVTNAADNVIYWYACLLHHGILFPNNAYTVWPFSA